MLRYRVVLTWKLEVLAILIVGRKTFPSFEGGWGCEMFYPVLKGGGGGGLKKFSTRDFHIL